jgi:signal transduction histidine kinase
MIMGVFLVILYLCAILTFIWIFAYLLKQKVMEPINRLTTGLRKITSGDRTARLTGRINVEFEEMQEAFNYMAGQLEEAENAKEAYERERSMIFSNISHDLKTPISTIAGLWAPSPRSGNGREEERRVPARDPRQSSSHERTCRAAFRILTPRQSAVSDTPRKDRTDRAPSQRPRGNVRRIRSPVRHA